MRVIWIKRIALTAIAAAAVVLQGAGAAFAQYNPYSFSSQPQPAGQNQYSAQTQYSGQAQYTGQPQQQAPPAYSAQPSNQPQQSFATQQAWQGYSAQPQNLPYPDYSNLGAAQQQPAPQYTAMSYAAMEHHAEPAPAMVEHTAAPAPTASSCATGNCQPQGAPAPMYQGSYGGGCDGGCYNYNTFDQGCGGIGYGIGRRAGCGGCGQGCLSGACCGCRPRWFGGVYGLLMERDRGPYVPISFSTPTPAGYGYYPANGEVNLELRDADIDFQGGLEFRLGRYFGCGGGCGAGGCGGCDSSGCGCGPTYGMEFVYWGLFEEDATSTVSDTFVDANRLYGMIDFRGLEYDPGTGYRSVNDYYDYGPPTADHRTPVDVEVRSFTVRSTFSMQNIEANLLRLPILCGGCGAYGGCGAGGCCGGCDSTGCGVSCGGCLPRYSLTTVIGARFMRFDDDFWFRSDYEADPAGTPTTGWLAYNVETDNMLYGTQLGCRGVYRLGSAGRFALHCSSNVGVYGNHIEVAQWMDSPTGTVRYANNGNDTFYVENEKDDVSILGELRLGASYQCSCNCRVYGGWRVLGATGVALSTDQIPSSFNSPAQTAWIHSNGSILVHGLQAGVEYNY